MPVETDDELEEIFDLETIAVVGCSSTPGKDAHEIPKYLLSQGYNVLPVNPNAETIFDRPAYDSLSAVPQEIDIVDIFRPAEEVSDIVDAAIARDDVLVVWTQLGIEDATAAARAEACGLLVVQDRCMKVEHQRLVA